MPPVRKAATFQGNPCKRGHVGVRRVRGGDCVECVNMRGRERWDRDPEHRERWLAHRRAAYATEGGREYRREHNLKFHYGLTLAEYESMFECQNHSCAICNRLPSKGKRLNVDHDHATGKVRALLCGECNRGLGAFQDSPQVAEQAAAYLRKHGRL